MQIVIPVAIFGYVLWLGLYLIKRNAGIALLRFAGAGTLVYALMLALDLLYQNGVQSILLNRVSWSLPLLLCAFWYLAILSLAPQVFPRTPPRVVLIFCGTLYLISVATPFVFDYTSSPPTPAIGYPGFVVIVIAPLISSLIFLVRHSRHKLSFKILALATLFALLGCASLLLIWNLVPRTILLLSLATDLALFGAAIAVYEAHGQGEILLPHFLQSLNATLLPTLVIAGQVGLVMLISTVVTPPMLLLLLTTISTSVVFQVFSDAIQSTLDRLTFFRMPRLRQSRADLRETVSNLPRIAESLELSTLDDEALTQLTRRALSNFGNLPRLATSPLIALPMVEQRLAQRGTPINTLERAAELKTLLTESIERLKPRDGADFGNSNEWRYYNALYFPYVCGLKPYSLRNETDGLSDHVQTAQQWFQTQVPERTLHNWQNAAARLIANDLREMAANGSVYTGVGSTEMPIVEP